MNNFSLPKFRFIHLEIIGIYFHTINSLPITTELTIGFEREISSLWKRVIIGSNKIVMHTHILQ